MDIPDIKEFESYIFKRTCAKCSYAWFPRAKDTKRCPRCQTWLGPAKPTEDAATDK